MLKNYEPDRNMEDLSDAEICATILCFARIRSAFEMNNIQCGDVTLLDALNLAKITIRQAHVQVGLLGGRARAFTLSASIS